MTFTPQDQERYARSLTLAAPLFSASTTADDLISIKVRPLLDFQTEQQEYIGGDAYNELDELLLQTAKVPPLLQQNFVPIQLSDGVTVVFVRHESGPEIIALFSIFQAAAAATGAAAIAGIAVIKLVNEIAALIARPDPKKSARKSQTGGVRIEKRLRKTAKVVRKVQSTTKAIERAIDKVDDLIG